MSSKFSRMIACLGLTLLLSISEVCISEDAAAPAAAVASKRAYGPEQAIGEPNVSQAVDSPNAWASLGADDRQEWLVCEYDKAVMVKTVSVYESYKPGALYKLTAFNADGEEVLAWEGEDPTPRDKPKGVSVIPVKLDFKVRRIKIYLDSPAVPDWNEIDAVGLEDVDGNKQWAANVVASTTYAQPNTTPAAVAAAAKRNWGSEQVEGEPNTPVAGDQVTAWASATADGQKEWLICNYENARRQCEIVVHETFNPGAVYKITVFDKDGDEKLAWEGDDPTPRDKPRGISVFPVKLDVEFKQVKVYIDSPAVSGWNEIDAVGLRDADGKTQWAQDVEASTVYGVSTVVPQPAPVVVPGNQFNELKQEVAELKEQIGELKKLREEIEELKKLLKQSKP